MHALGTPGLLHFCLGCLQVCGQYFQAGSDCFHCLAANQDALRVALLAVCAMSTCSVFGACMCPAMLSAMRIWSLAVGLQPSQANCDNSQLTDFCAPRHVPVAPEAPPAACLSRIKAECPDRSDQGNCLRCVSV